jgi:hypothetical protein
VRRTRGQATAELALLMIIIVPVFLYTLFLEDLLRHKLQVQETVVTTPWDFHGLNYQTFNRSQHVDLMGFDKATVTARQAQAVSTNRSGRAIGHYARLMWCDHTSGYNSYDPNRECNDSSHHRALSAHACWNVAQAQELGCGMDPDTAASYVDPLGFIGNFKNEVHRGGEVYCSARMGVLNYFLPQRILTMFSSVDTTRTTQLSGDVHSHAGASASSTYVLTMQGFSVLHDPWAQATVENVNPPGGGVLQRRVNVIYDHFIEWGASGFAMAFLGMGVRDQLLSPLALVPADTLFSDNLFSANVAFRTAPGGRVDNYYASPWLDWQNDPVQRTWQNRGRYYMGLTAEPL